jgi:hypothetical protein
VPSVLVVGALHVSEAVPAAAATVTVTLWVAVPPAPVQANVKVAVALSAPVEAEPLVPSEPDQPPEAVQDVALVEDQLRVELAPFAMLVGLALSDTLGAGADTVTVADCDAEPPAPVQVSVYLVVAVSAAVDIEPLTGSAPLHPPEAVQAVALVEVQLKVEVAPLLMVLGFADKVTAGGVWVTDTVADFDVLPPLPVQVRP